METNRLFPILVALVAVLAVGSADGTQVRQQQKKPNILVIFGDDIGQTNVSVYSHGRDGLPHAATSTASPGRA